MTIRTTAPSFYSEPTSAEIKEVASNVGVTKYSSAFATECSLISVFQVNQLDGRKPTLRVHLPSIDDYALFADFNTNEVINLSTLTEHIYSWSRRTNCRYINIHALEDYCRYLGAYNIDWS